MGSIRLSGLNSGMDTDGMIKKIMDAEKLKLKKIEDKKTTLEWKQDKWKDLNTKLYNLYTKHISSLRFAKAYEVKKGTSSDEGIATVTAEADASIGNHTLKVNKVATAKTLTGGKLKSEDKVTKETHLYELGVALGSTFHIKVNGKTESFDVDGDTKIQDFVDFARRAGINANFDENHSRFYLSSKESGKSKAFTLTEEVSEGDRMDGLAALGLLTKEDVLSSIPVEEPQAGQTPVAPTLPSDYPTELLANLSDASNGSYTLDGIDYETESNTVSTNGLKINLVSAGNKEVRIGVTANVDEVYNKFKAFIKEYNDVLKEMNKLYYAESARKYKPLSKDEKEQMSEKEIEQWETKIKDSILRRDERLGATLSSMKNALGASVSVAGKSYSLATFGVMTSTDYHEKGLLHIFGDSEDGIYASKEDKFKKALSTDPDNSANALKEIMDGLYKKLSDGMKSTGLSSALTFYNDKEYKSLEETYKKQYNTMEEKLKKIEDKYYRQFTAMEKAMAKMNSQTNSLAGLLGGR